jgi:hypothetical protein
MERKQFLCRTLQLGLGCSVAGLALEGVAPTLAAAADGTPQKPDEATLARMERDFVLNWLTDLLDTAETELDVATRIKLIEGCGRGCYRRHQFKQDIARDGHGDVEKLIAAYKRNFEIWREGSDLVHIRYGETSAACYCPAAKNRPPKAGDLHCECTRTTHQTIFETALARPIRVEVLESLRRGCKTCHFLVHLA